MAHILAKTSWTRRVLIATVSVYTFGFAYGNADAQVAAYYDNNVVVDLSVLDDNGIGIQPRSQIANSGASVRVPPVEMPQSRLHGLPQSAHAPSLTPPVASGPKVPLSEPQSRIILKKPAPAQTAPALPASRVARAEPKVMTPVAPKTDPKPEQVAKTEIPQIKKPEVSETDIAKAVASPPAVKAEAPKPEPAPVQSVKVQEKAPVEPAPSDEPVSLVKDEPAQPPAPGKAPAAVMAEAPPPPPASIVETKEVTSSIQEKSPAQSSETAALTTGPDEGMRIVFAQGDSTMPGTAQKELDRLASALKERPEDRIQLQAYAGGDSLSASKARRLSLSRALSVRSYLIEAGIRSTRIDVRALGNKTTEEPFDRVDVNITPR